VGHPWRGSGEGREERWWTLDDLEGTDSAVYPRGLAGHLRDLLRHGPPERPLKLAR
jgi:hypothetical protein